MKAACVRVFLRPRKGYSENEIYATQWVCYMRSLLVMCRARKRKLEMCGTKKGSVRLWKWYLSTEFLLHALLTNHPDMSHLQLQQDGCYTVVTLVSQGHTAVSVWTIHRSATSLLIGLKVLRTQNTIASRLNLKNQHYLCAAEKPLAYCRFLKLSYGD